MDIVIASANKHKIEEFQKIFAGRFQNIVSMTDAGFSGDVEETGETLFENALIKAKAVSEALGVPVLSDDTGLIAVALKTEPGVRSARYAGDHDDAKNRKKLIEKLKNLDKTAYFSCVLVLYYPDGHYITAEGKTYGTIVSEERGDEGREEGPVRKRSVAAEHHFVRFGHYRFQSFGNRRAVRVGKTEQRFHSDCSKASKRFFAARPRWLTPFFSSGVASAKVLPRSSDRKMLS